MRPNPQETADLGTFTEEILNGKLHFLCSVRHFVRFGAICTDLKNAKYTPWKSVLKKPVTL